MKRFRLPLLAAAVLIGASACDDEDFATLSQDIPPDRITAPLTGAAERPTPVATAASGTFNADIRDTAMVGNRRDSLTVIRFELLVSNINAVTAGHIHAGGPEVVGPIMVSLFSGPTSPSPTNGVLRQADISRASTFNAPFTFDSVLTNIRNGTAYVNVHTVAFPGGEIRGQIVDVP